MRLLVVGGGGREHALCWALRRENPDADVFCAPGNPGTAELATNLSIAADDQQPHDFWAFRNASRARSAARFAASATWVAISRASPA